MISVVMPYWQRQAILELNLAAYCNLYQGIDIEIVIVDDGSPEPAVANGAYPWPVQIVRLPRKDVALNPSVALNAGVAAAAGDVIVLTNPEVVHRAPILVEMVQEIERIGPCGYVAAACWSIHWKYWYCHSTECPPPAEIGRARMPDGAGLHFCSMLYRPFFDKVGGFDEEYRDGKGYEDSDLLWRLHAAGASFRIRDDLVTDHHDCPRTKWPAGGADRNRAIFEARWPERC